MDEEGFTLNSGIEDDYPPADENDDGEMMEGGLPDDGGDGNSSYKKRRRRVSLDRYGDGEQHEIAHPLPPMDDWGLFIATLSLEDQYLLQEDKVNKADRSERIHAFFLDLRGRLTKRQRKIFYAILRSGGIVDVGKLEKVAKCSRRTVYYDIEDIKAAARELSEKYPGLGYLIRVHR